MSRFDNSVGRWLDSRLVPGRIAAECLDLPSGGEELFLDRAVPACVDGLTDLIGRSAPLAPLLQPVVSVLQELLANRADPDITMAFGETAFAQGSRRRGDGVLKAHPWFGALVSDSELRANGTRAGLTHLFGLGSVCSMLRRCSDAPGGLAKLMPTYALDLRAALQSPTRHFCYVVGELSTATDVPQVPLSHMAARIEQIDARFQQAGASSDDRTKSLLRSYFRVLDLLLEIERSSLPRTYWQSLEEVPDSLIRTREGDAAEGGKEDAFAYVDIPASPDADVDAPHGSPDAPRRVREPIASPAGVSPDTPNNAEPGSNEFADSEAVVAWERTVDEQRLLPLSWARMSDADIEKLRGLLLAPAPNWRATAVASIYGALTLGAHDSDDPRRRTLHFREPEDGFTLRPGEEDLYRPRLSQVQLVIEESRHPHPLENARGTKDAQSILAEIRERHNVRATQTRVANAFPGRMLDMKNDATLLYALFSTADSRNRCPGYYAGFPISPLREILLNQFGIAVHVAEDDPEAVIGSAGVPRTDRFRQSIVALKVRVRHALKNRTLSLAQRHNLYVAYSVLFMVTATTHRIVVDPLHDPRIFIPARSMAIGSDKACSRSHITRPLPLPETGNVHLGHYLKHLSALGAELLDQGLAIGHDILALVGVARSPHAADQLHLPFLFFLSEDYSYKSVSDSSLRQILGDWPWHEAAHRHWLSTALREAGVCPEYVDQAMGHWQVGESPLGKQSVLCASDFLLPVAQAIDKLLPTIGFEPLPGLFPHRPRRDRLPSPPADEAREPPTFGPQLRQAARAEPTESDEAMVAAVFNEALDHFGVLDTDPKIPDRVVHKARDEIVSRSAAFPERAINRLSMLREKTIELRNKGTLILVPGLAYQPEDDSPMVTDPSGWSVHIAQLARIKLAARIEDDAKMIAGNATMSAAFALAMTFGGLRPELRRPFVAALANGYQRVRDLEWLMLDIGSKNDAGRNTQRYIGDGLTHLSRKQGDMKSPRPSPARSASSPGTIASAHSMVVTDMPVSYHSSPTIFRIH
jgi:hypothetical protein